MHDLVGTKVETMHIVTGDAKPVRKRAYRQSPEMQRVMEKLIDEMLAAKITQPSESAWSAPCLLIKKSGTNEYRFVNDLQAVNKITKPIFWPLPTMEDIFFNTVSDKNPSLFTNIDMKHAYFQVFLDEESRPKTAFTVNGRQYEYCHMTMGLCNSAQTWQRLLTKVLSDMFFKCAIVYLDDILLMSCDFPEHYKHLEMSFHKFREANLRMNGKKCSFAKDEVKYIGHISSKHGVQIDPRQMSFHPGHALNRRNTYVLFWVWLIFTSGMLTVIHNVQHHYGTFCRRMYLLNGVMHKKKPSKV